MYIFLVREFSYKEKCFMETMVVVTVHYNSIVAIRANDTCRGVSMLLPTSPPSVSVTPQGKRERLE